MNDYKELIKRLRVAVDVHEVKGCVLEISAETCAEIADAIEHLVKERDAAVADLQELCECCQCKYFKGSSICEDCIDENKWEWRGVCDE